VKKLFKTHETYVALTVIALCLVIGIINPVFFSAPNIVNLFRNATVNGIMAFALMLGIIIGGIDVAFPAVAVCSMYLTTKTLESMGYDGPVVIPIIAAALIGTLLGLLNGLIITKFDLPAFIVTLGTSSLYHGLLVWLVGSKPVNRLEPPLEAFGKMEIFRVTSETTSAALPWTFVFMVGMAIIVWFILNKTMLGRTIFAIGGDRTSAERAGYPVKRTIVFTYTFIGMAGGLAGIIHAIQSQMCIPTDLMGCEMMIIAAVVLGGTTISGGRGTVLGTCLGLAVITIAKNSLILVGITSTWQRFVLGLIIVIGTAVAAYQSLRASRKIAPVMTEEEEGGVVNG